MYAVLNREGRLLAVAIAVALVSLSSRVCRADVTYSVSLDTSNYDGSQGPFNIDFQLNDGSTGDGVSNNTATITDLTFVGGGLTGSASYAGSASGDPTAVTAASGLVITDSGLLNDFNQTFTPGASLTFMLDLTTNTSASETAGVPDAFSFTVNGNNFASTAAVLQIDITGNPPTISTDSGGALGDGTVTAAPVILGPQGALPEPSTFALMGFGFVGLVGGGRWRRRAR
jgi:hypothetical protein